MLVAEDLGYSGKSLEMKVSSPADGLNSNLLNTNFRYQITMHLANSLELPLPDFEGDTEGVYENEIAYKMIK